LVIPQNQGWIFLGANINKGEWGFTCDDCPWVPPREGDPDYQRISKLSKRTGKPRWKALHYPDRCKECRFQMKRSQRMRRRLDNVYDECDALAQKSYGGYWQFRVPKLITFALPSVPSPWYEDREEQKAILNSKMKKVIRKLRWTGVLGGTYVVECTTRLVPPDEGFMWFKHHAHVHMLAVSPFIKKKEHFKEFSEMLMPFGLGRINYKAKEDKDSIAKYMGKYLVKENVRTRSFGVVRSRKME